MLKVEIVLWKCGSAERDV